MLNQFVSRLAHQRLGVGRIEEHPAKPGLCQAIYLRRKVLFGLDHVIGHIVGGRIEVDLSQHGRNAPDVLRRSVPFAIARVMGHVRFDDRLLGLLDLLRCWVGAKALGYLDDGLGRGIEPPFGYLSLQPRRSTASLNWPSPRW